MTTKKIGRLLCRPAKHSDHDAIIAIGMSYGGLDKLQEMLYHYLRDPKRLCLVGEIDGKVMVLAIMYIIDNGQTVVGTSFRIFPKYRQSEVGRVFKVYAHQGAVDFFPQMKRFRVMELHNDNWNRKQRQPDTSMYEILHVRHYVKLIIGVEPTRLQRALSHLDTKNVQTNLKLHALDADELRAVLEDRESQNVFVKDLVFLEWIPFSLMSSNIDIIVKNCKAAFISKNEAGYIQSLSLSVPQKCPLGLMSEFDYYGEKDAGLMLSHIIQQTHAAFRFYKSGSINVSIFLERDINITLIESKLQEVGLHQGKLKKEHAVSIHMSRERFLRMSSKL